MVSIIILSFNTEILLRSCLASIYEKLTDFDFEVIVVDNASTDNSVKMVKKEFKQVKLIVNKENVGFAAGNNIGAKEAKGKYLLFLNSDTKLLDDNIKEMTDTIKNDPKIAIVGGRLENAMGATSASYGMFLDLVGVFRMLFLGEKVQESRVDWVSGGFMLVSSSVYKKLLGFDEKFFMYVEDMEFCYRAKQLGYETHFFEEAKALHQGQGSSNRSFAIIHIYKGILYFYKLHKAKWQYNLVKCMLLAKGWIVILFGSIMQNKAQVATYRKAIQF